MKNWRLTYFDGERLNVIDTYESNIKTIKISEDNNIVIIFSNNRKQIIKSPFFDLEEQ